MRFIFLAMILLTGCGTTSGCSSNAIQDTTPSWRAANRMAGELEVDCNSTTKGNGIIGCAFFQDEVGGNLTIPALYSGNIKGVSYNCKNFSATTDAYNANYLQMTDLYTATNGGSCSWTLGRTITDGKYTADDTLMSRVFIKIIPKSKYYAKMTYYIGTQMFTGVGWYQVKTTQQEDGNNPSLIVWPSGYAGTFEAKCGDKIISTVKYTTRPFTVDLPLSASCDVEMVATNTDTKFMDYGTYVHNVAYQTLDINVPAVSIKRSKITFSFNDKVGGKYVVFGVKAEATFCKGTNKCTIPHNKDLYYVKAMTMSARLFLGTYRVSTGKWEVK